MIVFLTPPKTLFTTVHSIVSVNSRIFEPVLFEALKDKISELIEDFSTHPHNYLSLEHQQQLDEIAYLDSLDR